MRIALVTFTLLTVTYAATASARAPVVRLLEDGSSFILENEIVSARIEKQSGMFSLKYGHLQVVNRGYWSQVGRSSVGAIGRFGTKHSVAVRVDPATNGGERAEVSCRFAYDGKSAGLPCDVDMRYSLGRGDSGLHVYAIWQHKPGDPGFSVGEGRMALKLNPNVFDFLTVDAKRRRQMPSGHDWDHGTPLNLKEARRLTTGIHAGEVEHKYDYSAILADTPAYGWSSTKEHVGVWMINPTIEYLAGGPTKVELTGHLDVNPGGAPTLPNMWHGSHYGGSSLVVAQSESWKKVIGPFLIYCNSVPPVIAFAPAGDRMPEALWGDALAQAKKEAQAWPYAWVVDPAYPPASGRGCAIGNVTVSDPQQPRPAVRDLRVGLAAAPYNADASGWPVDWQRDSKRYQFWTRAEPNGDFTLPNVRPGTYTLYAFADGVLGEFSKTDVIIAARHKTNLGRLIWTPQRYGRQLWEIGIPDRGAAEFRHGEDYWQWGLYYLYPKEFPDDVNFVIGKSDWHKDWNYCQPPRIEGDRVRSTTWSITFDLPQAPRGRATLRLAICGSRGAGGIVVTVNDKTAGQTGRLPDTGVMHRDGIRGYWFERDVAFDAALLKHGTNVIKLISPARSWVDGVLYDYLRLELDEEP